MSCLDYTRTMTYIDTDANCILLEKCSFYQVFPQVHVSMIKLFAVTYKLTQTSGLSFTQIPHLTIELIKSTPSLRSSSSST